MCHDPDSIPPIEPVADGIAATADLVLEGSDGNRFVAFSAPPSEPKGPGVVILPDVRGLYRFYEDLARRFAENGYEAVAIDYFGRTAGVGKRGDDFPYMEHIPLTTPEGIAIDVRAAVTELRAADPDRTVFTVGFCFGGSGSWLQAAEGHGLSGAIGFYGNPKRPPAQPIDRVARFDCPILGLMGGADPSIPAEVVNEYDRALAAAGVDRELVVYPGAPHSFFDRKQDQFGDAATDAWQRVLEFISVNS
jgi:carboxymethylenebutenolidase